ncbi:MAG: hypothetical protein LBT07_01240 [Endomicrobium sp.]|nr:hypothetical protein [Endomicrobium sp.]
MKCKKCKKNADNNDKNFAVFVADSARKDVKDYYERAVKANNDINSKK